jgi:hypothetical protein
MDHAQSFTQCTLHFFVCPLVLGGHDGYSVIRTGVVVRQLIERQSEKKIERKEEIKKLNKLILNNVI